MRASFNPRPSKPHSPPLAPFPASISCLWQFEHFFKFYVDIGLGIFALVNAGVKVDGLGAMSLLVPLSLLLGKTGGVIMMDYMSKCLGFPAPLGIRSRHIRMIGLIASLR